MNVEMFAPAVVLGIAAAALARSCTARHISAAERVRPYALVVRPHGAGPVDRSRAHLGTVTGLALFAEPLRRLHRTVMVRLDSRSDEALVLALQQAGRGTEQPSDFRLAQAGGALAHAALFGAAGFVASHSPVTALVAAMCGGIAGASRVRGRLDRTIARRAEQMELELYTLNQLLALHVRSGAGPMQAVQRIVERCTGEVVDELNTVLVWVRNGMREHEAFRRAAAETPCPAAGRTYVMFALATERGSDLAGSLLAVGADLRESRREALRKHAVKQRAAMLAPTIGVLAPIMLLFVAAPLPSIVLGGR